MLFWNQVRKKLENSAEGKGFGGKCALTQQGLGVLQYKEKQQRPELASRSPTSV